MGGGNALRSEWSASGRETAEMTRRNGLASVRGFLAAGGVVSTLVLVAACGGSSGGSGGGGSQDGGGTGHSPAASTVVETHSGPLGTYLTDGKGMTLYLFASDTSTKSTCNTQCLTYWPPLVAKGSVSVSGGAESGDLGTITATNGSKQVTYDGHPLYYYLQDTSPGQTTGQGVDSFGAKWWLVAPSGKPITGAGSTPPTSTGSSGGGGYSY